MHTFIGKKHYFKFNSDFSGQVTVGYLQDTLMPIEIDGEDLLGLINEVVLRRIESARDNASDGAKVVSYAFDPSVSIREIMASIVELTPDQRKRYEQMTKDFLAGKFDEPTP